MNALKTVITLLILSFLLSSCSPTFEQNNEQMSYITDIPGGAVQLSGNPIYISGRTGKGGSTISDLKTMLKVTCTDGSIAGGPWIDRIAGTEATFDISAIVDTVFEYQFEHDRTQWVHFYDQLAANITVQVGAQWTDENNDIQQDWSEEIQNLLILKGKLDQQTLAIYAAADITFYSEYIQSKKFLTNRFNNDFQTIHVAQITDPVKVWQYREDGDAIEIRVYYTDNTSSYLSVPFVGTDENSLFEFEVDKYAAWTADSAKTVTYYEFIVGEEKIIVYVDNLYHEVHEEFYIKNHLSAIECINCYGSLQSEKQIEKETFTTSSITPSIFKGTVVSQVNGKTDQYKVNTGFKTLHERKWIAELLASDVAWWKSSRLLHLTGKEYGIAPINILSGTVNVDLTSEDLMSIEFEFKIAHND